MKFTTKTILALSIMSTSDVNGHGRLTKPDAPQVDGGYGDHYYTQGKLNYMIHNYTCKFLFQGSYYSCFYYFFLITKI